MCGIAGIFNFDTSLVAKDSIEKMIEAIDYRGPDDKGYYVEDSIGLGHCRLSIIDLSEAGHQPMADKDESLWIIYNGEIYNYVELREELKKLGYRFKSHSDTEVVLYSYKEWGVNGLNKLNGMWAFAIWNTKKKELFCSRDRFGIKPFYYYYDKKGFAFASEIKSLLELGIKREANEDLICDFLAYGMLDHTDETFFTNIKKLPPASWSLIKENGEVTTKKYWDFEISNEFDEVKKNNQKDAEDFLDLFIDSVKLRMRSDVPIGSCLSGGLDSSSIVCVLNDLLKKTNNSNIAERQKTISSCSEQKSYDEREYIEEVLAETGAEKNYVFPKPEDFIKELDDILWHQEEPFASTGIYAQWEVMKKVKNRDLKVMLDGQGGDENLCGYRKFYMFYLRKLLKKRKYFLFLREFTRFFTSPGVLRTLRIKDGLRYFGFGNKLLGLESLFAPEFLRKIKERELGFGYKENLGERIKDDITTWSLPVLLRYEDKSSMAHSIETRLPFLDYRLVEQMASLPLSQKMYNGWTKFILRESMKGTIPEKIRLRKSKLGFSTAEELWFKKVLNKNIKTVINESRFLSSYINKEILIENLNKFFSGKSILSSEVFFRFYILELWGQKFILNSAK